MSAPTKTTSPRERLLQQASFVEEVFERLELPSPLVDKELTSCTFRGLKADASIWKGVRLEDCVFEDCDLTRAQLPHTRCYGVTFRGCKLMGIDWSAIAANPTLAFEACDLRYTSFVKVNLRKTVFRGCKATESSFIECQLGEADFSDTDLTGANFEACELGKANLASAQGVFLAPGRNRVKDTRISVETAVLMALAQGMKVAGYAAVRDDRAQGRRSGR